LHSPVASFHDILGSHCAELIAGVTITVTAIATKTTAMAAVKRPRNHLIVGLPLGHPDLFVSAYSVDTATTR
jgi:hypothetical protein